MTALAVKTLELPGEEATVALGQDLAPLLVPGMNVWLEGDLGAGKTTLVRAMLRRVGYMGAVKSPTYALVEVYVVSSIYWYHFDFYRFSEPKEFLDAGLEEYFCDEAVCVVEWPDKAAGYIPSADLAVSFQFGFGEMAGGRRAILRAYTERGRACLNKLPLSSCGAR